MTTKRDMLAARFPDELVKWKPGAAIGEHRASCEKARCREARDPAKHMQFAYVEDEAVMDRLDDVLGMGSWSWRVEAVGDGVVRGSLAIRWDEGGEWVVYQDFGYCDNPSSTAPLKEASTDAFRRCGRLGANIARYIYAGELEQAHRPVGVVPSRPAAPQGGGGVPASPPPQVSDDPAAITWDDIPEMAEQLFRDEDVCPDHAQPWKLVPAGVSKTSGKAYDAFWTCPERGCKARPSAAWAARHER